MPNQCTRTRGWRTSRRCPTPSQSVRHAAAHAAGLWRDRDARWPLLCQCLEDRSPAVARAAAEAIGRLGDPRAGGPLLSASRRTADDRVLEHSIIYALIEINDASAIRPGLGAEHPRTRRAALIALSQLAPGDLTAADVLPLLTDPIAPLRDAAWWIAERRPKWGEQLSGNCWLDRLHGTRTTEDDEQLLAALAQLSQNSAVQQLVAQSVGDATLPAASQRSPCGRWLAVASARRPTC